MKIVSQVRNLFVAVCSMLLSGNTLMGQVPNTEMEITELGHDRLQIRIHQAKKYLLLPIEEGASNSWIEVLVNNKRVKGLDARLAVNKVDYFVPVDLSAWEGQMILFTLPNIPATALCLKEIKLSETFDTSNREKYRPVYHFSPPWGWMNDPNGMVYKDGEYHLFYQHNPYGSVWGNMHWGHAVSKDLTKWEHLPVAIDRDDLGAIFSGSAVVDADNTAGFGAGAIVAIYTSEGFSQTQCIAYSTDNGRTFTKYDRNPVLVSNVRDFRDPKVFWHNETHKWIMILAVGQEMQIFSSSNLKEWVYESNFGEGQGAHAGVWECPDLFELPVKGTNQKKWVLLCNLNPGGLYGGSATQYFVGSFDGKTFTNESPSMTKWMDWGKDHYATVSWSNAPEGRTIAIAWMSNWQYANEVPTKQYRSANSIARDLYLYNKNGETYLSSVPVKEMADIRGKAEKKSAFSVNGTKDMELLPANNNGAYEVEIKFKNNNATIIGLDLMNSKGEKVKMFYHTKEKTFTMDRRYSGETKFSTSFPAATTAPAPDGKEFSLRLFVDKSSIEAFDGKGEFVMTNIVFPEEPYNSIQFYSQGGSYTVSSFTVYPLEIK